MSYYEKLNSELFKILKQIISYKILIILCTFYLFVSSVKAQRLKPEIYQIGSEWIYEYEYIPHNKKDLENIQLMIEETKKIDKVVMEIVEFDVKKFNVGLEKTEVVQDRLQQYSYPPELMKGSAAIIENNEKVWIHPPRTYFFKILELNPFPDILKPYTIGREWDWSLEIGDYWGNVKWKEWEGVIINKQYYKITGDTVLNTKTGNLHCYIVDSYAVSELGKTYLTSYFNDKYGFIKLDYTNIDGSKIVLNLIQHNSGSRKAYKVGILNRNYEK